MGGLIIQLKLPSYCFSKEFVPLCQSPKLHTSSRDVIFTQSWGSGSESPLGSCPIFSSLNMLVPLLGQHALGSRTLTLILPVTLYTLMATQRASPSMLNCDHFPDNCFKVVGVERVYEHLILEVSLTRSSEQPGGGDR